MKLLLAKIFLFFFIKNLYSQVFYDKYVNLKIGQGISFGGFGTALEYRYNRLSFMTQIGYQQEQYQYDHTIPSSWNFGFDTRLYISKKNSNWQLFTGIHAGWLSNYYHPDIGERYYKPQVYGIAFQTGIEVREDLLNIEIGLGIDPGKLIFNTSKHPYYSSYWYFSPNIGIGINLYALRSSLKIRHKRKISEKESAEPIYQNKTENIVVSDDTIHQIIIQQQAKKLIENCTNAIKSIYDRAYYQNDTLYFFKQIGISRYIYIKLFLPHIQKEQFLCFALSETSKQPFVTIISDNISTPASDELPYLMEEIENAYIANKGVLCVYIRPPFCYVNIENIAFKLKDNVVILDRVQLCEIKY